MLMTTQTFAAVLNEEELVIKEIENELVVAT